jgi:outer membrane receptor protein involved in Fe transport
LHNTGIDFDVGYRRNIEDLGLGVSGMGALSLNLLGTYNIQAKTQISDGVPTYDCAGYWGGTCLTPLPVWRHNLRLGWTAPWNTDFGVTWRHIGSVLLDANSPKFPNYTGTFDPLNNKLPSVDYIDLTVAFTLWDKYTLRMGVQNVTDKDPPVFSNPNVVNISSTIGAAVNSWASTYDQLGRTIFTSFHAKF